MTSPFVQYLPEVVPKESHKAWFQVLLPRHWVTEPLRPVCIHLAGTGDHHFWRRRTLTCRPLLKECGIGSIILENPFYGLRKPKDQVRSNLHCVSDIFVMGGCLVLESLALLHWCEREGFGPLGITGISMGGHMASLAGANWHKPLGIIPCLSWTTASCVFTQGVMSGAIPWDLLQSQYFSDHVFREEIEQIIHSPERNAAFSAGQHFARNYPASMENYKKLSSEIESESPQLQEVRRNSILASLEFPSRQVQQMEALNFMRGIMDECTHLENFARPIDTSLAVCVAAIRDAYVLREGLKSLLEIWPGCEVRYVDCGHVMAFIFSQHIFRKAIADSLDKTSIKYYGRSLYEEQQPALNMAIPKQDMEMAKKSEA
ncbi:protein ABHD18-like isoform X2 [Ornithodoros turicata]